MVYEVWFERYERDDPIAERRDQLAAMFSSMLNELQKMINEGDALRRDLKQAIAATGDAAEGKFFLSILRPRSIDRQDTS